MASWPFVIVAVITMPGISSMSCRVVMHLQACGSILMSDSEAGVVQLVVLVCNFMSERLWDRICWAEDGPLHTRNLSHGFGSSERTRNQ